MALVLKKPKAKAKAKPLYQTGYKQPPKEHQFKKGQSGNPNGRPKKEPTLSEIVQREAKLSTKVTLNGKLQSMRKAELLIRRIFRDALAGDNAATRMLISLLSVSADTPQALDTLAEEVALADSAAVQRIIDRLMTRTRQGLAK